MKKLICSVLAFMIIASVTTCVFADRESKKFIDVVGTEYYAESAEILSELDILAGYADGSFGADREITRAEMAAIICRVIDKEDSAKTTTGSTSFDDVEQNHWATGYINIASKEGIINGDGDGKFRPQDKVSTEEAIKMIVCALKWDKEVIQDPYDWAEGYMRVANKKGITRNVKLFQGKKSTRGDVAVMIHQAIVAAIVAPEASLPSGYYIDEQEVFLSTEADDVDIYYTLNGEDPSINSKKYKKSILISETCILKAIAVKKGIIVSDIMSCAYDIAPKKYLLTSDYVKHGSIIVDEGEYGEDSQVYVRAVPDDGYVFDVWYTEDGGKFSSKRSSECVFTMPANDVVISCKFSKMIEVDDSDSYYEDDYTSEAEQGDYKTPSYVSCYDGSVIPEYDRVTGAKWSVNIHGQLVAPLSFSRSNAIITRYFYDSNAEQVEVYKNYLLSNGWTLNGTSHGGDSRGQSEIAGYSHKDSEGNTDAQVEINFFPKCGDVDIVCVIKLNN